MEPATHIGYLVVSVLLLPLLLVLTRPPHDPESHPTRAGAERRWDTALIAVACVALIVVDLRLAATDAVPVP